MALIITKVLEPEAALKTVVAANHKGVYASSGRLFRNAIFGRDSLEVAEDLMDLKPDLVENILITLASLQGTKFDDTNEEAPGKILHEYRSSTIDGQPLDATSRTIFKRLAAKWGGNSSQLIYYGSIDSTPYFIRVLSEYCARHGKTFLNKRIVRQDGQATTMGACLEAAVGCIERQLGRSLWGLLAFKNRNPVGLQNQAWKDSLEFYVHENGELANHGAPVASIEVQGLAYDALLYASHQLTGRAVELMNKARSLQRQTLFKLWLSERQYFALGIDKSPAGKDRIITTMTANPASLLDSMIFDHLPAGEKQTYISGIIRQIFSDQFLTDAGIRSRSLKHAHLIPYWDYHGSFVSWPKETYDIARGLRRQGFPRLAEQLENRLVNVVQGVAEYAEFIYVDEKGRVLQASRKKTAETQLSIDSTHQPESLQAWTISAVLAISKAHRPADKTAPGSWQHKLEAEILTQIPNLPIIENATELNERYPRFGYRLAAHSPRVAPA